MTIDEARALAAVRKIARQLKVTPVAAAEGMLRVANANMERAIRAVSVERGHDPRDFALVAFGGSGGLHACEIASELGIRTVIVPQHAGALSALGMLMADAVRDYAASALGARDPAELFPAMEARALRESPGAKIERSADVRYRGQSYELNVPFSPNPIRNFHREHQRVYGYATPEREVEIVVVRVRARRTVPKPKLKPPTAERGPAAQRRVRVSGQWREIPTTLVPADWGYRIDAAGNLIITQ